MPTMHWKFRNVIKEWRKRKYTRVIKTKRGWLETWDKAETIPTYCGKCGGLLVEATLISGYNRQTGKKEGFHVMACSDCQSEAWRLEEL